MNKIAKIFMQSMLVCLAGASIVNASEQVCVQRASSDHKKIVENSLKEFLPNAYSALEEIKKQDLDLYGSVIQTVSADIVDTMLEVS